MPLKQDSRLGRAVIKMAASSRFLDAAPRFVPRIDRVLSKVTGGRVLMSSGMVPSLVLTATGAKSGRSYDTPLATVPDGDAFYVVGSNFGREKHPAWTGNLIAHPDATATFRGRRIPVRARLLPAEEKQRVWPQLTAVWPNYDAYVTKSGGRDLRVFRLEPRLP
jgi:deazaflavin-dependent oxidoreductase (nitroreductase family)